MRVGLGAIGALVASPCLAQSPPFCGYSIRHGWFAFEREKFIDTRRATQNDKSGVPQAIHGILAALALEVPIDIYLTKKRADNAFASVAGGKKIMVVDEMFLEHLNSIANTEWAAIQVLAHEVGHHIAGFDTNRHRGELNADYWSGQALQRLGADREAATAAIRTIGSEADSVTHPAKGIRAETIGKGWDDALANVIDYSFCLACK